MKNRLIGLMGILAVALVFGIVAVGCPTSGGGGSEVSKFEGKWECPNIGNQVYTFKGSEYTHKATWEGTEYTDTGSFTYTDTKITFASAKQGSWTQSYSFSDGDKILSLNDDEGFKNGSGAFTKSE